MELIYHPDHDQRYAHVHPKDRWKYPDEIKIGMTRYKRTKPLRDITREDTGGVLDPLLLANDVPYTTCLYDGGS